MSTAQRILVVYGTLSIVYGMTLGLRRGARVRQRPRGDHRHPPLRPGHVRDVVDEVHLFLFPVVVGGGKAALPNNVRLDLELVDERCFGNGVVHLHHRTR